MSDNPYAPHIAAMNEKIAREREEEVTLVLKGKHLTKLRSLVFPAICNKGADEALLREIDHLLYEAMQKI